MTIMLVACGFPGTHILYGASGGPCSLYCFLRRAVFVHADTCHPVPVSWFPVPMLCVADVAQG